MSLTNVLTYMSSNSGKLLRLTLEHLQLSLLAILFGLIVGIPVGLLIARRKRLVTPVLWVANMFQTIPPLALVGFLMVMMGLGKGTGTAALFFYTLMPVIRSTYIGLTSVEPAVLEAARGMGMTRRQILVQVQMPLALSVVLVGVRLSAVVTIGTATIMSQVGAGGLGYEIFAGIARGNDNMLLAATIPVALLSILANWGLGWLERRLTSPGLQI